MEVASEFRKHAANCNKMAKVSKDTETKAVWLGLRSSTMPTDLNDHQRIRNANDPERRTDILWFVVCGSVSHSRKSISRTRLVTECRVRLHVHQQLINYDRLSTR
jgi:hypothetical protein